MSYVITTVDVNIVKTILTDVNNLDLTFSNVIPFASFEVLIIIGVLAGATTLSRLYLTNEGSTTNNILKR